MHDSEKYLTRFPGCVPAKAYDIISVKNFPVIAWIRPRTREARVFTEDHFNWINFDRKT